MFTEFENLHEIDKLRDDLGELVHDEFVRTKKDTDMEYKIEELIYGYKKYLVLNETEELLFSGDYGAIMEKALYIAGSQMRMSVKGIKVHKHEGENGRVHYTFKIDPTQITFLYSWFNIAGLMYAESTLCDWLGDHHSREKKALKELGLLRED